MRISRLGVPKVSLWLANSDIRCAWVIFGAIKSSSFSHAQTQPEWSRHVAEVKTSKSNWFKSNWFHFQFVGNFCASSQFINMTQVIASWLSKSLRGIKWCWPLPSPIRMSALMISPVRGSTWMWLNDGCINKCPMPNGVADPALASPSLEISSEMDQEIVLYRASALANNMFFADSMTHMTPVSPVRGFSDPDEVVVYRPIIIIRQDCLWERMTREWQENGTASEQIPMGFRHSHPIHSTPWQMQVVREVGSQNSMPETRRFRSQRHNSF